MNAPAELATVSADETRKLGEAVAALLVPGDVLALSGDLGAGKTTFVQGVAAGLGVTAPVVSPTFTLVREYEGRLPVLHVDVYRLDRVQDVLDLGFDEMLERGGVVLVEWGGAIEGLLPGSSLSITLLVSEDDEDRRAVQVEGRGPGWERRSAALAEAVAQWSARAC